MTKHLLDMTGVGRALSSPVSRHAVSKWLERYPKGSTHPFPEPDVRIGAYEIDDHGEPIADEESAERVVSGWYASRLPEIEAWRRDLPGRTGRPRQGPGRAGEVRWQDLAIE